jgi:chromosomal replication initiator protein
MNFCIQAVCDVFGIRPSALMGPSRMRHLVDARCLAALLLHEHSRLSLRATANALGRSDHTTALHWRKRAVALLHRDPLFCAQYHDACARMYALKNEEDL